ncbi:dpy-30 motif [Holotrichia oblita]|uniref:Dpy-30 motif n=2 Tax=Holotrichia oblita TaxID=644536 RepID=A0ACB9T2V8_HOLOL|nr:dpy-30 motif [Holotrichia oblita]KAI4461143.1 dpy-30 motif [Holotrichia oblita]
MNNTLVSDNPPKTAQVEMPFFCTEEGRYLASSLGDPLIKGLTEVANKRPDDPIAYLATYLYNFANNNRSKSRGSTQETQQIITGPPADEGNNDAVPATIEVVTLEPQINDGTDDSAFNATTRDEHGQSMAHFAAARAHGRNALFQLLIETEINIGYRDELYRTARDISIQANLQENTVQIDMYVIYIATKGDMDKLVELLLNGYDHIIDVIDEENISILEAVNQANQSETAAFLQSILAFEERRERVHHCIREGSLSLIKEMLADENETGSGKLLAIGRNSYGRCALHIAVLCQQEEIVDYLANTFPDTLKIGDNIERTALHYAMGVEKMESISRVLIKAGSVRVAKDLKGRQPTYYFMNKSDILRLQEEEEMF